MIGKEDRRESNSKPKLSHKILPGVAHTRKDVFFFVVMVLQSTGAQLFYKLSQKGGKYEYNTLSAMAVVEAGKLAITLGQILLANRWKLKASIKSFEDVSQRVYTAYILLAFSYAVYNQLIFYVMRLVDPGTFTLFKSLTTGVVALLNYVASGETLTLAQLYCIIIQICGIIPMTSSGNRESGNVDFTFGTHSMIIVSFVIVYGAFNTVYNSRVVKKESANYPATVQNGILYSCGLVFNLLFYFLSKHPGDKSFFYGYNNTCVVVLIILNSTVGVTISMVYKFGDAILKTLCQPLVSSLILFLSKMLFDIPVDLIKISGAVSVIFSTLLYLKLLPPPIVQVEIAEFHYLNKKSNEKSSPPCKLKGLIQVLLLLAGFAFVSRVYLTIDTSSMYFLPPDANEIYLPDNRTQNTSHFVISGGLKMTTLSNNSTLDQTVT